VEIRLGAEVRLNDGAVAGRLIKVVLEPAKGTVSHIVVADGGRLRPARLVPVDHVIAGEQEQVRLAIGRAELEAAPEFDEDDFVPLEYGDWPGPYPIAAQPIVAWGRPYPVEGLPLAPPEPPAELPYIAPSARGRAEGAVVLDPGMLVTGFEGEPIGLVEEVLSDPRTGKATYLVVAGEWDENHNRLVPVSWIGQVLGREIVLVVGPRVIRQLAPYPKP